MTRHFLRNGIIVFGFLFIVFGCSKKPTQSSAETGPPDVKNGKMLFAKRCSICHGLEGKGETRTGRKYGIQDFTDQAWQKANTDQEISDIIRLGKDKMPTFSRKFNNQELADLVGFIRELK